MGIALVKIKIMPESPASNLRDIESKARDIIEKNSGLITGFAEEPIAFGLKALFVSFEWPEERELEDLESELGQISEVKSAEVSDIRRAIG
ncbi:MAG: elongation factor 1-beta [Candidatus Pacearchaeota archaeon]|nr:elongation factor 1-beta [Candidatus Pacearchaeota archaeon]MDE1848433.1 elongation factor 1-beta [Nanoarchaeota archaeon]